MYKIENIRIVSTHRNDVYIYEIKFSINNLDINFTTASVFLPLPKYNIEERCYQYSLTEKIQRKIKLSKLCMNIK